MSRRLFEGFLWPVTPMGKLDLTSSPCDNRTTIEVMLSPCVPMGNFTNYLLSWQEVRRNLLNKDTVGNKTIKRDTKLSLLWPWNEKYLLELCWLWLCLKAAGSRYYLGARTSNHQNRKQSLRDSHKCKLLPSYIFSYPPLVILKFVDQGYLQMSSSIYPRTVQ